MGAAHTLRADTPALRPCPTCASDGSPEQRSRLRVGCPSVPPGRSGPGRTSPAPMPEVQSVSMITERPVPGRPPAVPVSPRSAARRDVGAVLRAYVALTKPRIVELLLITTVPAMMVAARGRPDLGLMLVVLVGGSLA